MGQMDEDDLPSAVLFLVGVVMILVILTAAIASRP